MRISQNIVKVVIIASLVGSEILSWTPTNFFSPYSPSLRLPAVSQTKTRLKGLEIGANMEFGSTKIGRNVDGKKSNILKMHESSQSMIAAFEQPTKAVATPEFIATRNRLRILGVRDDGVRGHEVLDGKFEQQDITPHLLCSLPLDLIPGDLSIGIALPFRENKVYDVTFKDLTNQDRFAPVPDQITRTLLTNDFKATALKYGKLDLGGWCHVGIGDLAITVDWARDYPQQKDNLENVELHAFFGLSVPTAEEKNEDCVFMIPFGHDGAWALPFGIGIDLDFKYHFSLGASTQFEVVFDTTKIRRIKTEKHQTEFLLFNKDSVTKDHGLTWCFNLYMQGFHFWRGLSLKGAYEYVKHDADRLTPAFDRISTQAANSAVSLSEWNMHHFIFQLNYDCMDAIKGVCPQLSLFYKMPLAGRKVINPETFGAQVALNF